jgi:hypothetical protein
MRHHERTYHVRSVAPVSARWLLPAVAAVLIVDVSACSSASVQGTSSSAAGTAAPASPTSAGSGSQRVSSSASVSSASASSASSASPASSNADRAATYAAAIAEVNAYLALWVEAGPYAAAAAYLTPDEQLPSPTDTSWPPTGGDPQTPILVAGSVVTYIPWEWTSPDRFMLRVEMNLTFRGDPARAAWKQGENWQFFTFTRPDASTSYRMYAGSGP